MKIGGSALLFAFGLHTLLSNPIKAMRQPSGKKGTPVQNLITSFFLTLSNPLIIFLFIALFAQLTFTVPETPSARCAATCLSSQEPCCGG